MYARSGRILPPRRRFTYPINQAIMVETTSVSRFFVEAVRGHRLAVQGQRTLRCEFSKRLLSGADTDHQLGQPAGREPALRRGRRRSSTTYSPHPRRCPSRLVRTGSTLRCPRSPGGCRACGSGGDVLLDGRLAHRESLGDPNIRFAFGHDRGTTCSLGLNRARGSSADRHRACGTTSASRALPPAATRPMASTKVATSPTRSFSR